MKSLRQTIPRLPPQRPGVERRSCEVLEGSRLNCRCGSVSLGFESGYMCGSVGDEVYPRKPRYSDASVLTAQSSAIDLNVLKGIDPRDPSNPCAQSFRVLLTTTTCLSHAGVANHTVVQTCPVAEGNRQSNELSATVLQHQVSLPLSTKSIGSQIFWIFGDLRLTAAPPQILAM